MGIPGNPRVHKVMSKYKLLSFTTNSAKHISAKKKDYLVVIRRILNRGLILPLCKSGPIFSIRALILSILVVVHDSVFTTEETLLQELEENFLPMYYRDICRLSKLHRSLLPEEWL